VPSGALRHSIENPAAPKGAVRILARRTQRFRAGPISFAPLAAELFLINFTRPVAALFFAVRCGAGSIPTYNKL
jgi:hypothetical protein